MTWTTTCQRVHTFSHTTFLLITVFWQQNTWNRGAPPLFSPIHRSTDTNRDARCSTTSFVFGTKKSPTLPGFGAFFLLHFAAGGRPSSLTQCRLSRHISLPQQNPADHCCSAVASLKGLDRPWSRQYRRKKVFISPLCTRCFRGSHVFSRNPFHLT